MSKEYLGKTTVASLIRLIKTELKKYVKMESMNERIPAPKTDDNGKFVKVVDGKYQPVEQTVSDVTDAVRYTQQDLTPEQKAQARENIDASEEGTASVENGVLVVSGPGAVPIEGTTDHSVLINRDIPDAHPMSAITGLEEAIANIPTGGGGAEWKHIRTVTVPTDASTDTSGVAWLVRDDGGYWFGFDTDEQGKPFEYTDLWIEYSAGISATGGYGYLKLSNNPTPAYASGVYSCVSLGSKGAKTNGYVYILNFGGSLCSYGAYNEGALPLSMKSMPAGNTINFKWTAVSTSLQNLGGIGFVAGSTFKIFGR